MPRRYPTFFPQRVRQRVPNKRYTAGIEGDDMITAEFGAPLAANNTSLLAAQSIASAGSAVNFAAYTASEAQMGRWGRGIRVVASGAATSQVTITGRDYLGQRMQEVLTLNGATAVLGVKAFRYIDSIAWGATAAITIDVGITNLMGLPEKGKAMVNEIKNNAASANAGTFVAGLANATTPTGTNADVRGTYLPATVIPDGTNTFEVRYIADTSNLHGNAQFAA
jgi:hypothetical protein